MKGNNKRAARRARSTQTTGPAQLAQGGTRPVPPWLLDHRMELPDVVAGYVERPELERRCLPLARHLTVLQAPAGFGKTALLAKRCRQLREDRIPVAWLESDEEDGPVALAAYLTLAFERSNVTTLDLFPEALDATGQAGETDSGAEYRINLLIQAVRRHGEPCVLALDGLERLRNPAAIALLNALLTRSPRNLHIALSFRERPPGLDIAMLLLEERGETLTAEDLRFSKPDIARFFDRKLSRRELASVAAYSAGWAIALKIYRKSLRAGMPGSETNGDGDAAAAWIESRFCRGLGEKERDFLLDVGLFDEIDGELIDEVTGWRNSKRRIKSMASLAGLLQTAGGKDATMQLHPLIREYCAKQRFREDQERFRSIHAGIARGLARRGQVVDALRHAAEAGDMRLAGEIAVNSGGISLWIGSGFDSLRAIDGWITPDVIARSPRLALMRCVVLALSGNMNGARRVYQTAAIESAGFTRGSGGDEDPQMNLEHQFVMGMLLVLRCAPVSHYDPLYTTWAELAKRPDLDPMIRGIFRYGLCFALTEKGEFDRAAEWAERARIDVGHDTQYLSPMLDYHLGIAAMAQGRTDEAVSRYGAALRLARLGHLGNAGTVMVGEILTAELEMELGARTPFRHRLSTSLRLLSEGGAWLDVYAASVVLESEVALAEGGVEEALAVVDNATKFARATERSALLTFLAARSVSLLVIGGRPDEATRAWRRYDLPGEDEACLDFKSHRWREVEAMVCARLRLLIAQEEFDRARQLASRVIAATTKRRLVRTLMHARVLSMRLEFLAGNREQATGHLVEHLALFADARFVQPLARERDIALPLLDRIADTPRDAPIDATAVELRRALEKPDEPTHLKAVPALTNAELEVLKRLEFQSDNEIANDLELTYDRVRYRVRGLFAKLDARGRSNAVHRARALGILPGGGGDPPNR